MKLRNKKTGEIEDILISAYVALSRRNESFTDGYEDLARYKTLAELNEDWEDYTPQEPRLEDEKVRKGLRTWAEVNGIEEVRVIQNREITSFCDEHINIIFYGNLPGLIDGAEYSITELCGKK